MGYKTKESHLTSQRWRRGTTRLLYRQTDPNFAFHKDGPVGMQANGLLKPAEEYATLAAFIAQFFGFITAEVPAGQVVTAAVVVEGNFEAHCAPTTWEGDEWITLAVDGGGVPLWDTVAAGTDAAHIGVIVTPSLLLEETVALPFTPPTKPTKSTLEVFIRGKFLPKLPAPA